MDETLIVVAFITTIGGLIGIEILNHNWFRRERFKVNTNFEKKSNDLKIKQLAKELGLSSQKAPPEPPEKTGSQNIIGAVLPELLKNMDPDTLANIATNLIGSYGGSAEEEVGRGGISDTLMDFIESNPEIVKGFLGGLKGGKGQQNDNFATQV